MFGKEKTLAMQEFNPNMEHIHIALRKMRDSKLTVSVPVVALFSKELATASNLSVTCSSTLIIFRARK